MNIGGVEPIADPQEGSEGELDESSLDAVAGGDELFDPFP